MNIRRRSDLQGRYRTFKNPLPLYLVILFCLLSIFFLLFHPRDIPSHLLSFHAITFGLDQPVLPSITPDHHISDNRVDSRSLDCLFFLQTSTKEVSFIIFFPESSNDNANDNDTTNANDNDSVKKNSYLQRKLVCDGQLIEPKSASSVSNLLHYLHVFHNTKSTVAYKVRVKKKSQVVDSIRDQQNWIQSHCQVDIRKVNNHEHDDIQPRHEQKESIHHSTNNVISDLRRINPIPFETDISIIDLPSLKSKFVSDDIFTSDDTFGSDARQTTSNDNKALVSSMIDSLRTSVMNKAESHKATDKQMNVITSDAGVSSRHLSQNENDIRQYRKLTIALLETTVKTSALLEARVQTKEIFALVVDNILNALPPIMLEVVIRSLEPVLKKIMGKFLQAVLPSFLIPGANTVPGGTIVSGMNPMPPILEAPRKPCRCQLKNQKNNNDQTSNDPNSNDQNSNDQNSNSPSSSLSHFVENNAKTKKNNCPCENAQIPAALLEIHSESRSRGMSRTSSEFPSGPGGPGLRNEGEMDQSENEDPVGDALVNTGDIVRDGILAHASSIGGGLAQGINEEIRKQVIPHLARIVKTKLSEVVTKKLSRALVTSLVMESPTSLTNEGLQNPLYAGIDNIYQGTGRRLTHDMASLLTSLLTPAVGLSVAHALQTSSSHHQIKDIYCTLCKNQQQKNDLHTVTTSLFSSPSTSNLASFYCSRCALAVERIQALHAQTFHDAQAFAGRMIIQKEPRLDEIFGLARNFQGESIQPPPSLLYTPSYY
eukprot:g2087.t1